MLLQERVIGFIKKLLGFKKKKLIAPPKITKLTFKLNLGPMQRSYFKMKRKNGDKNA